MLARLLKSRVWSSDLAIQHLEVVYRSDMSQPFNPSPVTFSVQHSCCLGMSGLRESPIFLPPNLRTIIGEADVWEDNLLMTVLYQRKQRC